MTADEMFNQLGYKRYDEDLYERVEKVDDRGLYTYTQIVVNIDEVTKNKIVEPERAIYEQYLTGAEVIACAQLIKEIQNG